MPKTQEEIAAEAAAETAANASDTPDPLAAALAEAEKWKALSRKNEADKLSNAEKAKKYDELEEANKTEQQKLIARAEAAEKWKAEREAKDEAEKLRAEVAADEKYQGRVPASALRGSTREELEAHADQILALLPEKPKAPSADGQGVTGQPIGEGELSAQDIVAKAKAR